MFAWCGGVDFSDLPMTESTTTISCSTAANDPAIPVGATAAAKVVVGGYVHLSDGGTEEYTGRVVRVNPSSIECEPAPIRAGSFTQMDFWPVLRQVGTRNDGEYVSSAGCVGTFASGGDTRLLLGDVTITDSNGKTRSYPNRIVWSVSEASDATVSECDGLIQAKVELCRCAERRADYWFGSDGRKLDADCWDKRVRVAYWVFGNPACRWSFNSWSWWCLDMEHPKFRPTCRLRKRE